MARGKTASNQAGGSPTIDAPSWWSKAVRDGERLAPPARPVLARIEASIFSDDLESEAHERPFDALEDVPIELAWMAVREAHGRIDVGFAANRLSLEEADSLRQRLCRLELGLVESALQAEVRAHRQLLRDISHDIRSPLNSILFLADGLYGQQSGPLSKVQRRQMGVIYSGAASLLNLVNDLLDFARSSEGDIGRPATVPFSLPGVLADVRRLVNPLAAHRSTELHVELDCEGPCQGDPQLVSRLLMNLVSNAIDAAGDGGRVLLRATEEGPDLELVVEDNGPGADLQSMRQFLSAQPDASLTRMLQGRTHGLGLIICGRLVRAAGGSIDVDLVRSGGTRFSIRLPYR